MKSINIPILESDDPAIQAVETMRLSDRSGALVSLTDRPDEIAFISAQDIIDLLILETKKLRRAKKGASKPSVSIKELGLVDSVERVSYINRVLKFPFSGEQEASSEFKFNLQNQGMVAAVPRPGLGLIVAIDDKTLVPYISGPRFCRCPSNHFFDHREQSHGDECDLCLKKIHCY